MATMEKIEYVTAADLRAWNPFGITREQEPRRKKAKVKYKLEKPGRQRKPKREPKFTFTPTPEHREKMLENSQKAKTAYKEGIEKEYTALIEIARQAKESIGEYAAYLHGTNHKCLARRVAWERFIKECARLRGEGLRENTLRRAIRVVMDGSSKWMMPDQHTARQWIREEETLRDKLFLNPHQIAQEVENNMFKVHDDLFF
jgi:hypothetical protein